MASFAPRLVDRDVPTTGRGKQVCWSSNNGRLVFADGMPGRWEECRSTWELTVWAVCIPGEIF